MRLYEFKSALNELDLDGQLAPEERNYKTTRLAPEELEFILDLVKDDKMSQSELSGRVNDALVDYSRNKNSLRLAAPRMYALVHGALPLEMEDKAGWFATIPTTMIQYAESKGYEVADNLRRAKIDARNRKAKLNDKEALNVVISYFNDHEHHLDKQAIVKNRSRLVKQVKDGEHVDVVFDPYFISEQVLASYYTRIIECKKKMSTLTEATISKEDFFAIGDMLQDALNKYSAAKRGLGIANKLQDPADRAVHRSRIMGNMNRLRALVRSIEQKL
jgi:hypothetical protein